MQKRRKDNLAHQMQQGYNNYGNYNKAEPVTINAHEITALQAELKQISAASEALPVHQKEHEAHVKKMHALIASGRDTYLNPSQTGAQPLKASVREMKSNMMLFLQVRSLSQCCRYSRNVV